MNSCRVILLLSLRVVVMGMVALGAPAAAGADAAPWPVVHRDHQRSGYTEEVVRGPYERKWFRDFHDEMIATRVEAILADGKCFVGTFAGRLYALDVATGRMLWQFQSAGPVGASPCYRDGKVYFGSDDGHLYCLSAADGKEQWRYAAGGGVWAAPACDGRTVYVGDRAGAFHAVAADTGTSRWTFRTGNMILAPASLTEGGDRIVFGSEDMHVYCLDAGGKLLWKSAKLGGLSLRDHAPTIWKGLAIVTTNPARDFHSAPGQNPAILTAAQKALPIEPEDKVIFDKWGSYAMKLTPRRLAAEHAAVRKYLSENRPERTFYALDLKDGSEPWVAPVLYTGGLHNPPTPPTFDPRTGELFLWTPTALSNYSAGVPGGAIAVAKLNRQTGLTEILWHANGDKLGWAFDFAAPADEAQALSLMGPILLNTHQGIVGGMDRRTLKWHKVYIARDTYGGIFGPAAVEGSFKGADKAHAEGWLALMPNEWHGPDRGVVSIGYGRIFWVAGSQVVCLAGPDTPGTDSGGTRPPPPVRRKRPPVVPAGNVAAGFVGRFDSAIPKPAVTPDQMRIYLRPPAQTRQATTELATSLRGRLDAAVTELVGSQWAPLVIELGISKEDRYFWRTAETMQVVAPALPHLSPDVRVKAVAYLDQMFADGAPLRKPTFGNDGRRREFYDLGRGMAEYAAKPPAHRPDVGDLYALWAYAHYADRCQQVLADLPRIQALYHDSAARPVAFDHDDVNGTDAAETLNRHIAGSLAYARIADRVGRADETTRALTRLADLVAVRAHHEMADTRFVRTSGRQPHTAKIPRYCALAPECAGMLHDVAGDALRNNVRTIAAQLPLWHHAFGERMIGGENYISPPTLAQGVFAALAGGEGLPAADLAGKLDQPWCRADLYYVQKITSLLGRLDAGPPE